MALPDLQPIQVSFGDVFKTIYPNYPPVVATGLSSDDAINTSAIGVNNLREEIIIPGAGNTSFEFIQTRLGHWSLDRMIVAATRGLNLAYSRHTPEIAQVRERLIANTINHFTDQSQKPPVLLKPIPGLEEYTPLTLADIEGNESLFGMFLRDQRSKMTPQRSEHKVWRTRQPGLRQDEVSRRVGLSTGIYYRTEKGQIAITPNLMGRLTEGMNLSREAWQDFLQTQANLSVQ